MGIVSRGFTGRRGPERAELPPGQYLTTDFPVLSAGPTPVVRTNRWTFTITTETGRRHEWDWRAFRALPTERFTVDLHCVTRWSKLATAWEGVSLDTLFAGVATEAEHALVHSHGGYTTNLPLADLL
ncbi:MAG TPA: molybdopterin-dependent oxidoreductase, partial [Pseudonocardiaceae bacterium]|nr:molybdopterin-dependent oxidoreductase [Pseudonocardiaceae bacterium]